MSNVKPPNDQMVEMDRVRQLEEELQNMTVSQFSLGHAFLYMKLIFEKASNARIHKRFQDLTTEHNAAKEKIERFETTQREIYGKLNDQSKQLTSGRSRTTKL